MSDVQALAQLGVTAYAQVSVYLSGIPGSEHSLARGDLVSTSVGQKVGKSLLKRSLASCGIGRLLGFVVERMHF
jgi:hypothetical protein